MSEEAEKKPDNRWWEFYFVRYFVGTAIGAIVVLFLATSNSPVFVNQGEVASILKLLKPINFESGYIAILATVGLAFCYIASSPILVLHATRGSLIEARANFKAKWMAIFVGIVATVTSGLSYALWEALNIQGCIWDNPDFYTGSVCLCIVTSIFVGQTFLLFLSIFGGEQSAFEYYDKLVAKRAKAQKSGKEYMESYRHLREHGNAFLIVLLELLLGAALFYSPVPWAIMLMLWIFPAAGVWVFGTILESRYF